MNYTIKHNDIFDSLQGLWDSHEGDVGEVKSKPTTYEIRDKNFDKLWNILMNNGYKITQEIRHCSDGDEMEITEIRGPKASGFFIFFKIFCNFYAVLWVWKREGVHSHLPHIRKNGNYPRLKLNPYQYSGKNSTCTVSECTENVA